jgi:hypothetical protein
MRCHSLVTLSEHSLQRLAHLLEEVPMLARMFCDPFCGTINLTSYLRYLPYAIKIGRHTVTSRDLSHNGLARRGQQLETDARSLTHSFIHHARTFQSRHRRSVKGPKEEGKG